MQEAQFCQKIVFRISRNFKTIKSTIIQILKFKNRTHSLKFWGRNIGMWKIFHRKRAHTFPGSEQITWKIPLEINFEQRQICRNRQQVDPPPLAVPKQHNGSIQGISFWGRKKIKPLQSRRVVLVDKWNGHFYLQRPMRGEGPCAGHLGPLNRPVDWKIFVKSFQISF